MSAARVALDAVVSALFAPLCVSCHAVLDAPTRSPACDACWRTLRAFTPPLCDRCGEPVAGVGGRHGCAASVLTCCRAIGWYEDVLRDLIHAVKYDERRTLATALAPLLIRTAGELIGPGVLLVPVPLHPWRHWSRGFNQADDIARALGRHAQGVSVVHALRRARHTRPQSDLDAEARRRNVRGAFALAGSTRWSRRRRADRLADRPVVLVDDVMTTGATLEACAQVLLQAGAREVSAVTLARVANPQRRT
jgi:ComF family protein